MAGRASSLRPRSTALDRATLPPPDYFPEPYQIFPVIPADGTAEMLGLAIGIVGLLILPKFLILVEAALIGRVRGFGGLIPTALSTDLCPSG